MSNRVSSSGDTSPYYSQLSDSAIPLRPSDSVLSVQGNQQQQQQRSSPLIQDPYRIYAQQPPPATNGNTVTLQEIRASLGPPMKASSSLGLAPSPQLYHSSSGTYSSASDYLNQPKGEARTALALHKIRESLQPFHSGSRPTELYDTLSSESSSGTNGSTDPPGSTGLPKGATTDKEGTMLEELVRMGFEKEPSWYALKLTQFRNITAAVDILLKAQSTTVFLPEEPNRFLLPSGRKFVENGFGDQGSRSESPLQALAGRVPSPQAPFPPSYHASHAQKVASMQQLPMYAPSVLPQQRAPSPYTKSPVTPSDTHPHHSQHHGLNGYGSGLELSGAAGASGAVGKRGRTHHHHPMVNNNAHHHMLAHSAQMNGGGVVNGGEQAVVSPSDYSIKQSTAPVVQAVSSKRVEKPVAQSAVSPTVINVAPGSSNASQKSSPASVSSQESRHRGTPVISARLDPQSVSSVRINVHPSSQSPNAPLVYRVEANNRTGNSLLSVQATGSNSFLDGTSGATTAGIQRIVIDELGDPDLDPANPTDKTYIDNLCKRVSSLLGSQSPLGKRDSTASSNSESGLAAELMYPLAAGLPQGFPQGVVASASEPSFASLLHPHGRGSPVSSLSTESSNDSHVTHGVARSCSPLPESVAKKVKDGTYETCVRSCLPKAFRFFMEQHVENLIKSHKARHSRLYQLEMEMTSANFDDSWRVTMRNLLAKKESRYLRLKRQKMEKSAFHKIATIGVGAFGEVALVRNKETKALYAMKTLRKSDVLKRNQAAHVKAERDILSEADNEWVVKLFFSFQNSENLYFIMEYIPGGDLMSLLIKKEIFEESLARFYMAELVCAIDSVHRLGFIHRDIKPDNILIDRDGHIKLTDFGLCTGLRWTHDNKYYNPDHPNAQWPHGHARQDSLDLLTAKAVAGQSGPKLLEVRHSRSEQRKKAHSLVGTPNYIAPEVLMRVGHEMDCDWWSVGVILYEMVVGRPPFLANTARETQDKVIHWRETLHIPEECGLSLETTDIITKLCRGPDDRLGKGPGGAEKIKAHPFFKKIQFETLRQTRAPYIPEILHETDTSNFDQVEPSRDASPQGGRGAAGHGATRNARNGKQNDRPHADSNDHAFYEFTFRRFFDSDPLGCPTIRQARPSLAPLLEQQNSSPGTSAASLASADAPQASTQASAAKTSAKNILRISTGEELSSSQHHVTYSSSNASNTSTLLGDDTDSVDASGPGRPRPDSGGGRSDTGFVV